MKLLIGKRAFEVSDFAAASAKYENIRGHKSSRHFPEGRILDGDNTIARVSYNAKIWPNRDWQMGDVPLYNPYA